MVVAPGWTRRRRPAILLLASLVVVRAVLYAAQGVNFILDDWTLEYLRAMEGTWRSVPAGQDQLHARPGAWVTYTVLHGVVGPHPLVQLVVLTVVNVAVVLVLYGVLARFLERPRALLVSAIWAVLPIHQSMGLWSGASPIAVGTLLLLLGVLALSHGRWLPGGLALAASILCYELSAPVSLVAGLVVASPLLPLHPDTAPSPRTLTNGNRAAVLFLVVLATWWSSTHAIYPIRLRLPNPAAVWSAHFGHGLFGSVATPLPLVLATGGLAAIGVATGLVAWLRGDRARDGGPALVLAGLVVFVLGLGVVFTVHAGALGFNDRLYAVSSIGAAMMVTGVGVFAWGHRPAAALALAASLVAVALVGQFVSVRSWSQAGADVVALLDHLEAEYPDAAHTNFIVGPTPRERNNVSGVVSPHGGAEAAFRLWFPDADPPCQPAPAPCTGSLVIARSADDFVPTARGETLVRWSEALDGGDPP